MKKSVLLVLVSLFLLAGSVLAQQEGQQRETKFFPQKVEADKNYDGVPDYAEYFVNGKLEHREADTDYDGQMDEWTYFDESGTPIKTERDTNKDGKPDTWVNYAKPDATARRSAPPARDVMGADDTLR